MTRADRTQPEFLEHACIATRMIDKRRHLFDIEEKLKAEKIDYDRKSELLRREEEDHHLRDIEFQQNLIKFEKAFIVKKESAYLRASKR